jgi:hypothetical protein
MSKTRHSIIAGTEAKSRHDAVVAQKYKLRALEQEFAVEDRREQEQRFSRARQMAGVNPFLLEGLDAIEVFTLVGCHPTFAIQAYAAWLHRSSSQPPDSIP